MEGAEIDGCQKHGDRDAVSTHSGSLFPKKLQAEVSKMETLNRWVAEAAVS